MKLHTYEKNGRQDKKLFNYHKYCEQFYKTFVLYSCGVFKGKNDEPAGYAIGGIGYDNDFNEVELDSAEMYIVTVGEWVLLEPLPNTRYKG